MSVFTTLNLQEVRDYLRDFNIGEIEELRGIAAGITNTNYFVITAKSKYVLTIFEKNSLDELPYFVGLMAHLAKRDVLCPTPIADKNGVALHQLKGKPALMVSCLQGKDIAIPSINQVQQVARALAHMHNAGADYSAHSVNQRDMAWRNATAQSVLPKLLQSDQDLLISELNYLHKIDFSNLPKGVIHGDLFRDNVLFNNENLGGFIDFYYACNDCLAYDVAIAVNEWCVHHNGADIGELDAEKVDAFLAAYEEIRPFYHAEYAAWYDLCRLAALRFWLSRLYDFHFPKDGELTHTKDPNHFKHILQQWITIAESEKN
jgi:homoserine kinase type II